MPQFIAITVIVPCYQGTERLLAMLPKIAACDPLPDEVIIHCDGGWKPEVTLFEGIGLQIRWLYSEEQIGPGGGREICIRESKNELVASFDDDSWPLDPDYFAQAQAIMEAFPNAAILSPAVYLQEKPLIPKLLEVSTAKYYEGCASIHRRSHHLEIHGFAPIPAAYGVEETDLSLQIHTAGKQILSSPWMRAWHERPLRDNAHQILPWIKNEVLLGYLRYPWFAQPWGWWRAVRKVLKHRKLIGLRAGIRSLLESVPHCQRFKAHTHRYTLAEILAHLRMRSIRYVLKPQGNGLDVHQAGPSKRILYLQYTNPGAYPPLIHSSKILARRGWEVMFLGLQGEDAYALKMSVHLRIVNKSTHLISPGWMQKVHYLFYALWATFWTLKWKPDWIYASDSLSTPIVNLIQRISRVKILYHEHDYPSVNHNRTGDIERLIESARTRTLTSADAVVAPNEARLRQMNKDGAPLDRSFCVWNTAMYDEITPAARTLANSVGLTVLYHGSLVPARFPMTYLQALSNVDSTIDLKLIGYRTNGHYDYVDELQQEARRLGIEKRFEYLGPLDRPDLLEQAAKCHVGLAMLNRDGDLNMKHMVGASNKPFDYLSQGLAIIVSNDPEWKSFYVGRGCAIACDPNSARDLENVLRYIFKNQNEIIRLGENGRQLCLERWNYERQFEPIAELLNG